MGETTRLLVIGALSHGYIAVTGGWIGSIAPKHLNKYKIDKSLEASVYIGEPCKVEGKYPVKEGNRKHET